MILKRIILRFCGGVPSFPMIPKIRAKIHLFPLMLLAAVSYDLALWWDSAASVWLTAASAAAFCMMARANTARQAFYGGIGAALLIYVPHLWFLTSIFQLLAGPLWLSLALWPGVFCGTLHVVNRKLGAGGNGCPRMQALIV